MAMRRVIVRFGAMTNRGYDKRKGLIMELEELNFDELLTLKPHKGDLVFNVNGMTADEYISKITKEMNEIDLSSVPIDKWDIVVTFSLSILEVAGDFFIGDPSFKYSLANKNGPFCKWLKQFHDAPKATDPDWVRNQPEWIKKVRKFLSHSDQAIDSQAFSGSKGEHRAKSFSHDLPLTYFLYRRKAEDGKELTIVDKAYNASLILHDIFVFSLSVWSISTGKYIDFEWGKDGSFIPIKDGNWGGEKIFSECNLLVAIIRYIKHMVADICSSTSLPIPGFSILMHVPDRDIEAFALKLYRNGMNLRTMTLQMIPIKMVELMLDLYVWLRSKDCGECYSEAAWEHKKHKLLLISHGITTAVNVGKVVITEAPWRLNLVVIARTFHLVWLVTAEETMLTNRHIEKLDSGIIKARVESCKTLVLLEESIYETENVDRMLRTLSKRMKESSENIDASVAEVDSEFKSMLEKVGG